MAAFAGKSVIVTGASSGIGRAQRRRLLVTSFRGRAGRFVRLFAPGLIDRIALRAVRDGK